MIFLRDEIAACYSGRLPIVSSYTAHFGEEPVLSGTRGAGNIFFGNCNLRCVYCQNYQISQTHKEQIKNEVTHEHLAEMMLELQRTGCHNINFVSPTHFAPQMARAILLAAEKGLTLPIVYNTNAYDSVEVLRLLDSELTGPEIARELYVTLNTLRTHTKRIFTKLDVNSRAAAVRRARQLGLL